MAFTFQIHSDLTFQRDEKLLAKADALRPVLQYAKAIPVNQGWREKGYKRGDRLLLDFGRHMVGRLTLKMKSQGAQMDAPLTLKLRFAEIPAELESDPENYDGWLSASWIQQELLHEDILPITRELPRRYSFRYLQIDVIDTSPKWQVVFEDISVETETSASSRPNTLKSLEDKTLQKIQDISLTTLAECMQDVFEDGPKRDRRLWLGDLRLQALASYCSYKNVNLVKRCLYLFGAMTTTEGEIAANVFTTPNYNPDDTFLLDYSLFFISVLSDLIDYEGTDDNREILADLYPIAKRQLDIALQQVTREGEFLPKEDRPVFIDWSNAFDKTTAGQAVYMYVLRQFLSLARYMEEQEISFYEERLETMLAYSRTQLFDVRKGLFTSGKNHEVNVAGQVWMVLADVFEDRDKSKALMETMVRELFPVTGIATPYMYHHIVQALLEAGLTEEAIRLIKNYWGKMVELGADTFWEALMPENQTYSPYGDPIVSSYCHAWACTPVWLFQNYLKNDTQ